MEKFANGEFSNHIFHRSMTHYEGVNKACCLKFVLISINLKMSTPIANYENNDKCIAIANNPTDHRGRYPFSNFFKLLLAEIGKNKNNVLKE